MLREIFLGFMKVHILYHTSKDPVYGVWIMKELERHGYTVSPGTIYPTLNFMEKEGLLSSYKIVVNGKMRRYYKITEKGKNMLEEAREKIKELSGEVL
jgi:DNA-binding PadR family transcriptional regulator